eukprot:2830052-Prymnesium_polylepis.1
MPGPPAPVGKTASSDMAPPASTKEMCTLIGCASCALDTSGRMHDAETPGAHAPAEMALPHASCSRRLQFAGRPTTSVGHSTVVRERTGGPGSTTTDASTTGSCGTGAATAEKRSTCTPARERLMLSSRPMPLEAVACRAAAGL